jgi:hypothetical protein
VTQAARRFLRGYLPYLYGRVPASRVLGATRSFVASLPVRAPGVSPAMHARQPRVVALRSAPGLRGRLTVAAVINDGGLVDYPIALILASVDGRLLVSGIGGA